MSVPYPKDTVTPLMEEQKKKVVSSFVKPLSGSSTNIFSWEYIAHTYICVTDLKVVHVQSYIYSTVHITVHACLCDMTIKCMLR